MRHFLLCVVVSLAYPNRKFLVAAYSHIDHHETYEEDEDSDEFSRENKLGEFKIIVPGTKWCGTGNISNDNFSLGPATSTDNCCRTHDFCPDVIKAGDMKFGLANPAFYSRLSCSCDEDFYNCLKMSGTRLSNSVGTIYFNMLGTQCYREDYPVVRCVKYQSGFRRRCIEYEYDTTKEKIYQWFDEPYY